MIELRDISRRFGAITALSDVSLTIAPGSFTALLGPSGCGKSTLLRLIAGLDRPDSGEVLIAGRSVAELTPSQRNIAMVFQSYALYPHMTVRQNITLPLAMRNMTRLQRLPLLARLLPSARQKAAAHAEKVRATAAALEIESLLDRKPSALSGGQKQRVALGRALVRDPVAFLLDEPLSNLDAKLRLQMRGELVDLHRHTGRTFVYVTHDQAEAMSMSDRIAVMIDGRIVQEGTPQDLYQRPQRRSVAAFVGDHPINLLAAEVTESGRLSAPFAGFALQARDLPRQVIVGIRAEALNCDDTGALRGVVSRVEYLGGSTTVTAQLGAADAVRAVLHGATVCPMPGASVALDFDPQNAHIFDARSGLRLAATLVRARQTGTAR